MSKPLRILVVGGGISGLSAAVELAGRGHQITVWEADSIMGGKIRTHQDQGYTTESAASMIYNFLPQVDQFFQQVDLQNKRQFRSETARCRYLVKGGTPVEVPFSPKEFLTSPFWPVSARLRMMAEPIIPRRMSVDEESVASFIRRRFGSEFLDQAMDPFLGGTLATDPEMASATATLPRLTALESQFGSVVVGALVKRFLAWKKAAPKAVPFSFVGGMSELIRTLARISGVTVRTGFRAVGLNPLVAGGWEVEAHSNQGEGLSSWDRVVLAVPALEAAQLTYPLSQEAASGLREIRYAPITIVHTGLSRNALAHPLDGIGCMVPFRERMNLTGTLWVSSSFPGRAPTGQVLFSNYVGGIRNQESGQWSDQKMSDRVLADLKRLFQVSASPDWIRIDRHHRGLPVYDLGHCQRIALIQAALKPFSGLTLVGNYLDGVSIRDRLMASMALGAQTPLVSSVAHPFLAERCQPAC